MDHAEREKRLPAEQLSDRGMKAIMPPPDAVRTVVVTNPQGLHARPADLLAKLAQQYVARIEIIRGSERNDAKSIFSVLTLGAEEGTELQFEAFGPDAVAALDAIAELFAGNFGEE